MSDKKRFPNPAPPPPANKQPPVGKKAPDKRPGGMQQEMKMELGLSITPHIARVIKDPNMRIIPRKRR